MRISTSMVYAAGQASIGQAQQNLYGLEQKLSSGKARLSPADDPAGAGRSLLLEAGLSQAQNYSEGAALLQERAGFALDRMKEASGRMQSARESVLSALSGGKTGADRVSLAQALRGAVLEAAQSANARNEQGEYVFSGIEGFSEAAAQGPGGWTLNSATPRSLEIGNGWEAQSSWRAQELFAVKSPFGAADWSAGAANAGGAWVGQISGAFDGAGGVLRFAAMPDGSLAAQAFDLSGNPAGPAAPYAAGMSIKAFGVSLSVSGAPAAGDSLQILPSQSIARPDNWLAAASQAADLLEAPPGPQTDAGLMRCLQMMDAGSESMSIQMAKCANSAAQGQSQIEALGAQTASITAEKSRLDDLDYVQAASEFAKWQNIAQAGMKAFAQTSQLSLFNYLP